MVAHDPGDRLAPRRQDVQPQQDRPQAVLLAHVIGAGAEALLAAQGDLARIEQVAEELPAGRRLVAADAERLRDPVGGARGRHGARDPGEAGGVAGREMGVGGEDREAVRGRHVDAAAENHVAIAIAVRGGAEVRPVRVHHGIHQLARVRRVGVRMMPAEVLERLAVDDRARGRAERPLQNRPRIGPGDRRHGVVADAKAALEERRDALEIEQPGHQLLVVGDRIDDLDRGVAKPRLAQTRQVEIPRLQNPVLSGSRGCGDRSPR